MQNNAITLQAMSTLAYNLGNALIKRIPKGDMCNHTAFEVSPRPHALSPVNDLVRDNKIAWLDCLLETANSGEGDDAPNTD